MSRAFLSLLANDELAPALLGIERAVSQSLRDDGARVTSDELRRRFAICERLIRQLRGDLGWGLQRVLDHLPHYLRCELDGQPWQPDARTIWMPQDGA